MFSVSVIICTYNREDVLVNTIKDVLSQEYAKYEVVVVDQTKEHLPRTQQFLDEHRDRIKYFQQEPSLTKARNRGLAEARGDILIFIDDDVILTRNFISSHVDAHTAGFTVVQGRVVVDKDSRKKPASHPQFINRWLKIKGRNDCLQDGITNTLTGCNFSIRSSVVDVVGVFDEFYQGLAIREDADYGLRCYLSGQRMIFWANAELRHLRSKSGGVDTGISYHFLSDSYYRNEIYFCQKHFSKLALFIYKLKLINRARRGLMGMFGTIIESNKLILNK